MPLLLVARLRPWLFELKENRLLSGRPRPWTPTRPRPLSAARPEGSFARLRYGRLNEKGPGRCRGAGSNGTEKRRSSSKKEREKRERAHAFFSGGRCALSWAPCLAFSCSSDHPFGRASTRWPLWDAKRNKKATERHRRRDAMFDAVVCVGGGSSTLSKEEKKKTIASFFRFFSLCLLRWPSHASSYRTALPGLERSMSSTEYAVGRARSSARSTRS